MLISSLMYRNLEPDEFRTERVVTFQNCLSNAQQSVKRQLRNYPKHVRLPRLPMLQTETALNESRINKPLSAYRVASVESTSHCVRNVSRTTNHQSIVCVNAASLESPRHCVRIVNQRLPLECEVANNSKAAQFHAPYPKHMNFDGLSATNKRFEMNTAPQGAEPQNLCERLSALNPNCQPTSKVDSQLLHHPSPHLSTQLSARSLAPTALSALLSTAFNFQRDFQRGGPGPTLGRTQLTLQLSSLRFQLSAHPTRNAALSVCNLCGLCHS